MERDEPTREDGEGTDEREHSDREGKAVTRRTTVTAGATLVGGLLAGCLGGPDSTERESAGDGAADDTAATDTTGDGATSSETDHADSSATGDDASSDAESGSYTVSISPVGEVTFESPPQTVFTRLTHHADMAFALGRGDGITAMHAPDYYDGLWNQFIERLPGVTLDWSGRYSSWQPTKEKLYDLDSDVHLADPAWVTQLDAWDRDDIEEIAESVGPWFGNSLSDRHQEPPQAWAEGYEYYGLWEQFELVAQVFREEARYAELAAVREDLLARIEADLPSESERPSVVMIAAADVDQIYTYTMSNPGFLTAHTRPLKPRDAFEGRVESGSVIDFEVLLEADPEVILYLGGVEPGTDMRDRREIFESDPIASEIAAVKHGRVFAQGARYQGPILNLFQLEMTAKQLYPEAFGEWPTYETGPYPEIPDEERLFDREAVAAVIEGDG